MSSRASDRGGTIHNAIYLDLLPLRADYEKQCQILHQGILDETESSTHPNHLSRGSAFGIFKTVFRSSQVALLHTRRVPSPCDRASYSQLLYQVCWSLLDDVVLSSRDGIEDLPLAPDRNFTHPLHIEKASFAIFCLYALYQTNPLKDEAVHDPHNDAEKISWLTTGFPHSHKYVRRAFRAPIRTGIQQYMNLCQLSEQALQECATCEASRLESYRRRLEREWKDINDVDNVWRCSCFVASDVGYIIRRLMPLLEYCSYTGPCGLEALVQHPEYRCSTEETQVTTTTQRFSDAQSVDLCHGDDHESDPVSQAELETHLQEYLESLAAIRFPAHRTSHQHSTLVPDRLGRVREQIAPLFETVPNDDRTLLVSHLLRSVPQDGNDKGNQGSRTSDSHRTLLVKRRRVTFEFPVSEVTAVAATQDRDNAPETSTHPESDHGGAGNESHLFDAPSTDTAAITVHEVRLPNGLSDPQRQSIQAAIECLLNRSDTDLEFLTRDGGLSKSDGGDELSRSVTENASVRGMSIASTTASNAGRLALETLLSQATQRHPKPPDPAQPQNNSANRFLTPSQAFLDASLDEDASPTRRRISSKRRRARDEFEAPTFSDLSSGDEDEDNDLLSVSASAVGRTALSKLLAQSGGSASNVTKSKKTRMSTTLSSGDEDEDDNDLLSVAASAVGRTALSKLLAQSGGAAPTTESKKTRRRTTTSSSAEAPPRKPSAKRKKPLHPMTIVAVDRNNDTGDDKSAVSSDNEDDKSIAASMMGRNALERLLNLSASSRKKTSER